MERGWERRERERKRREKTKKRDAMMESTSGRNH